jgi:hypothetical protein
MLTWYVPSQVFTVDLRTYKIFKPQDPTMRPIDYSIEEDPNWSPDAMHMVLSARDPSVPKLVVIESGGLRVGEISISPNRRCWQADWAKAATR